MELLILIVVGIIFGLFRPSKNNQKSRTLNNYEKYETFKRISSKKK